MGAAARYLVSTWAADRFGYAFPLGTLIVNVVGSLLLGLIVAVAAEAGDLPPTLVAFAGAGFCGAFTTFSTFAVETIDARPLVGTLNALANNVVALLAAGLGLAVGTRVAGLFSSGG